MVELLRYLEANGFTNYIASGGDRDFMRPSPRRSTASRPSASSAARTRSRYMDDEHGGTVTYQAEIDVFDDGPSSRSGSGAASAAARSLAGGNSNGDIPMLALRRQGRAGAAAARAPRRRRARVRLHRRRGDSRSSRPRREGWTVVSIKNDWATVF